MNPSSLPLSPAGRRYGRSVPPPLPPHRMLNRSLPANIPAAVDFRSYAGPMKDQGQEGSCTGHAFPSSMEWIFRKYFNKPVVLSPQFFYAEELLADGDFPQDEGSTGLTGCNVAVTKGCCELSLYPYEAGNIVEPTPAQLQNALQYTMGAYHGITNSSTAISVLGDPVPWPIAIGFTVYESFESDWAIPGVMPLPDVNNEEILGGHEVACTGGYDVGATPTLRPAGCPPAVLIQNSWGSDWALNGWFWMPIAVLDAPDTDMKVCHTGHPWR